MAAEAVARTSATESAIFELVNMAVSPLYRDQGQPSLTICKKNIAGDARAFYPTEVSFWRDRGLEARSYARRLRIIPTYLVKWSWGARRSGPHGRLCKRSDVAPRRGRRA